jgi:anti-sigma regulatory factor (Ser/Thr protein kinase)
VPRSLTLPYRPDAGRVARRFVRGWAADVDGDGTIDMLCLITSELVTNGFMHGDAPLVITVSRDAGTVTIEVADSDPNLEDVQLRIPDESRPGGRGLRIVASLAERWGARPYGPGKIVWATLVLQPAEGVTQSRTADSGSI